MPTRNRTTTPSAAMDAAIAELRNYNILRPTRSRRPPSGGLHIINKGDKTALIFDLHDFSLGQANDASHFSLPSLPRDIAEHLLSRHPTHATSRYLARLDVSRYYDSVPLPPGSPHFIVRYRNRSYTYTRLPFGWDRSPHIAQHLMLRLATNALSNVRFHSRVSVLVYIDDILILADSATDAALAAETIAAHLRAVGLVVNERKSILEPTTTLVSLGKNIDASTTSPTVSPTLASLTSAARTAAAAISSPCSRRRVLATAGAILWTSRRALPFLQPAFANAHAGCKRSPWLPTPLVRSLSRALRFAANDAWCGDTWQLATRPVPVTDDTFFVDASAERRLAAVVLPTGESRVWRIPAWIMGAHEDPANAQQAAELFATCKATRMALARGRPAIVVPDSASAIWAAHRLSSGAFQATRALLLQRLARSLSRHHGHHITLAWIGSSSHPADPLTYPSPDTLEPSRRLAQVLTALPPPPYHLNHS